MEKLTRDGDVLSCDLGDGESRLDIDLVAALQSMLDSNGLDPASFLSVGYLDPAVRSHLRGPAHI
ncbi:hypothetical protein ABLE92_17790 [Gordonia sp. VNQ95]|uniref:hypothetical protein n=1 Tax=Gordonia sp. VNQ95 TaxID=3156619 RepID=UPI0032B41375